MKVITIVGVRESGKTTIVEQLTRELIRRGYRVGTIKSIFCPGFHMDSDRKNTGRHRKAGAGIVTARAGGETAILFSEPLKTSDLLRHYEGYDWVLCEGDYEIPAPRIVAGKEEQDTLERLNPLTLAVSGVIAGRELTAFRGIPVIHPVEDAESLVNLLETRVSDVEDLTSLDMPLKGEDIALSRDWCRTGCRGHRKKESAEPEY